MTTPVYKTVILKISGESLGSEAAPLDRSTFEPIAHAICAVREQDVRVVVVVGGGNLFRGPDAEKWDLDPADGDIVGMQATGLNVTLLAKRCAAAGVRTRIFSRGPCSGIGLPWERHSVLEALDAGFVAFLAGGMGVSGMSTDFPAVHAAAELGADAVLMAKHGVDGVYDADPKLDSGATRIPAISATDAIQRRLAVMDFAALELAAEHHTVVHVVAASNPFAFCDVLAGRETGSRIDPW